MTSIFMGIPLLDTGIFPKNSTGIQIPGEWVKRLEMKDKGNRHEAEFKPRAALEEPQGEKGDRGTGALTAGTVNLG
jgi:hypothetical protein